jgi:hypothetical protein
MIVLSWCGRRVSCMGVVLYRLISMMINVIIDEM